MHQSSTPVHHRRKAIALRCDAANVNYTTERTISATERYAHVVQQQQRIDRRPADLTLFMPLILMPGRLLNSAGHMRRYNQIIARDALNIYSVRTTNNSKGKKSFRKQTASDHEWNRFDSATP